MSQHADPERRRARALMGRRSVCLIAAIAAVGFGVAVRAQTISTYAGGGDFSNAPALTVSAPQPLGAAIASDGTVFYTAGQSVYHLAPSAGTVTLIAGLGLPGYSGDGGLATSAQLSNPIGVAVDTAGNVYIADSSNNVVRRVDALSGVITTVAGTGIQGYSGDGGAALSAQLFAPYGVAVDSAGNLYIADQGNEVIRRVDAASGTITTVAGNGTQGYSGDGGPAGGAELNGCVGITVDAAGNLYIADSGNDVIRRVDAASGTISTVAGTGTPGYSGDGGPATSAQLAAPAGVALDAAGNLYIADASNSVIRRVLSVSGTIATVAGTGQQGGNGNGGPATNAQLALPHGVAVDAAGNLFIADEGNYSIRRVDSASGNISIAAGNELYSYGGDGGPATAAQLYAPYAVALDAANDLYILDTGNIRVRRVDGASGSIAAVAGDGHYGGGGDGGPATSAQLLFATGIAADTAGNLYISVYGGYTIRRVDAASGTITTVAGNGTQGYSGDGGPAASAQLNGPYGVAIDAAGNLFIADVLASVVRRVDAASGTITTVAGNGTRGYSGDGGPATSAQLAGPYGLAIDVAGNLVHRRFQRHGSTGGFDERCDHDGRRQRNPRLWRRRRPGDPGTARQSDRPRI
jgi:sugar lactone lactonase YvrE